MGSTPTRPADVRPVSKTMTTRRSRSGPPGAHHDVGAARGGAPVDGPDVVADDVFTQRVEFGALPADQHRDHALELPQLGQSRRQMLTGQERRQDPDLPRNAVRALSAGKAERTDRAGRDQRRLLIAAAHRPQPGVHLNLLSRGDVQWMGAWFGAPTGRPGVAHLTVKPPAADVVDRQPGGDGLAQPCGGVPGPVEPQPAGAACRRDVNRDREHKKCQQGDERRCGPG